MFCCILGSNGLQNKTFELQIQFWQNQARSQVLRFEEQTTFLGGKALILIICLKKNFLSTTKFGGAQKKIWV